MQTKKKKKTEPTGTTPYAVPSPGVVSNITMSSMEDDDQTHLKDNQDDRYDSHTEMNIDPENQQKRQRSPSPTKLVRTIYKNQAKESEKPQQAHSPPFKKTFNAHSIRRTKKNIQIDYTQAKTHQEAYKIWVEVMNMLRKMDNTITIFSQDQKQVITATQALPTEAEINTFAEIKCKTKPYYKAEQTYASITAMSMARPLTEMKRNHPELVPKLQDLQVFLRSTTLDTVDTVEIGFFLGLHPSLTNVEWRAQKLREDLGNPNNVPYFELYTRRLTEYEVSTSAIVLRCAKTNSAQLHQLLRNTTPNQLGKNVEFIPYEVSKVWNHEEYINVYYHQNEYIENVGAIPIQGLPEEIMESAHPTGNTLHQQLLKHSKIQSIEKSGMPQVARWWVLTKESDREEVTQYLNADFSDYINQEYCITSHDYSPPCDIPKRDLATTLKIQEINKYSDSLLKRIQHRPPPKLRTDPPTTGRPRPTYAATVSQGISKPYPNVPTNLNIVRRQAHRHGNESTSFSQRKEQETKPPSTEMIKELKATIKEMSNEICTAVTPPSTVTQTLPDHHKIIQEMTEKQQQTITMMAAQQKEQMDKMMEQVQKMMDMFSVITNLMNSLLPQIIKITQTPQLPPHHLNTPPAYQPLTNTPRPPVASPQPGITPTHLHTPQEINYHNTPYTNHSHQSTVPVPGN